MAQLIFTLAFLHSSSAHSHFTGEGTGKEEAGKIVKEDPQLNSLP